MENIELSNIEDKTDKCKNPVNYETAVSLVGFGKYNYFLLFICASSGLAQVFSNSSMSYVLPHAQCDLQLSLQNKGMLNAVPYIGIISSGLLWGTLADNYGRRFVLTITLALDAISNIIASTANTYWLLLTAKYLSGFMICGPIAVFLTYVSEFHHFVFRPKLITIFGIYYGVGKIILPLIAWVLLPLNIHFVVLEGIIEYHSWQIFLLCCCLPATIGSVTHFLLPESPKFLMSKGKYNEALDIFKQMYVKNTGKTPENLPFSSLIDNTFEEKQNKSLNDCLRDSEGNGWKVKQFWSGLAPFFLLSNLYKLVIAASINFSGLLGTVTLRLWLPQLLATMDEFTQNHNSTDIQLCDMLNYNPKYQKTSNESTDCTVPILTNEAYLNNLIVPVFSIVAYFIVGFTVNKIGKKNILIILPLIGGVVILSNYFSKNSLTVVVLSSIFLACSGIISTVCTSVTIELFPTTLRAKALAIVSIIGRFGPLTGNMIFPFLLYAGCLYPFIFMASFAFLCTVLSLFLPQTEKTALI